MKNQKQLNKKSLINLAVTAMLTSMSFALFLLEFPVSLGSSHLKMDFSDIPALFAAVFYGPVTGVLIELMKNLLELIFKGIGTQMGFGNIMNFLVGCAYIVPFSFILRSKKLSEKKSAVKLIIASVAGVLSIVSIGFLGNYIITPPFFSVFLKTELSDTVLWGAIGSATLLNAVKGIVLSAAAVPIVNVLVERIKKISK